MQNYVNDRMSYTVKDLWNLKIENKVYAGRSRQNFANIKMTRQKKQRLQHNRDRAELKKTEIKMAKSLVSQIENKQRKGKNHDSKIQNSGPPQVTRPKFNKGMLQQKDSTRQIMTAWDE